MNGIVYLVHFERPYKHARHYIGFTTLALEERMQRHRDNGRGARLLQVVRAAGIRYAVVRRWTGVDRAFELRLKARGGVPKQGVCPVCTGRVPFAKFYMERPNEGHLAYTTENSEATC